MTDINIDTIDTKIDIKEWIKCPICYELIQKASVLDCNCTHVFCNKCITDAKGSSCPICKSKYGRVLKMAVLDRIIKDVKAKCPNDGCNMMMCLMDHEHHKKVCLHEIINCETCKKKIKRLDLETFHNNRTCDKCHQEVKKCITDHEKSCPETVVACVNKNCTVSFALKDKKTHVNLCSFENIACLCGVKHERQSAFWMEHNKTKKCQYCQIDVLGCVLETHEGKCPEKITKCKCGSQYKIDEKKYHKYVCPDKKILCPNTNCTYESSRREMITHYKSCTHSGDMDVMLGYDYFSIYPYQCFYWKGKETLYMKSFGDAIFARNVDGTETFIIKYLDEYKEMKPVKIAVNTYFDFEDDNYQWRPVRVKKIEQDSVTVSFADKQQTMTCRFDKFMERICFFRTYMYKYPKTTDKKAKKDKPKSKRDEDDDYDYSDLDIDSDESDVSYESRERDKPKKTSGKKSSKKSSYKY